MTDLFNTPFKRFAKIAQARHAVGKYSPDQPRGKDGKWTAGGVARAALAGGAALGAGALFLRRPAAAGRAVGHAIGAARYAIRNPARAMGRVGVGARRGLRDLNRSNIGGAALGYGLHGAARFGEAVQRGGARFGLSPAQSAGAVGGGIGGTIGGYIGLRRQQRQQQAQQRRGK